jgi:hypothetical protein
MLRAGGKLVITCPTGRMFATERHFGHIHHPTPEELTGHAGAAGLRLLSLCNWGWPTYRLLKWATNVNSDWALSKFASGAYSYPAKALSTALYWLNYANRSHDARGCQIVALFQKES